MTITSEELSDLPTALTFNVYDPPASPRFTGNASNCDIHVQLAEPVRMNRVFTTDVTPDPLDREAARIDLVLDGGVFNVNYFAETNPRKNRINSTSPNWTTVTLTTSIRAGHRPTERSLAAFGYSATDFRLQGT